MLGRFVTFDVSAFMGVSVNSHPRGGHPFAEIAARSIEDIWNFTRS
jgi:hypothetical protein